MTVTTTDLEARALSGDASAFGELIRDWDQDLRGVVWVVVRSHAATDTVMQRSYETAFRDITRFDGQASMKTWLHAVCLRSAIDHSRQQPAPNLDAEESAAPSELGQTFDSLGRIEQVLLMLTAGLGYSFDETATIVGLERGSVASKVARARVDLRNRRES